MNYREINNRDRITEYRTFFSLSDYAEDETKLYFSNTNYNALVIVDKATWSVEKMIPFEKEERAAKNLHLRCVKVAGRIFFLPAGARHMHVYDTESEKQSLYSFADKKEGTTAQGVWDYFAYDDRIYFLPGDANHKPHLWDARTGVSSVEEWWNISSKDVALRHGPTEEACFYSYGVGEDRLYITDLSKRSVKEFVLPDEHIKYVAFDGQNFWYVTADTADIVCWNREQGEIERYSIKGDIQWEKDLIPCVGICHAGGKLYLLLYNMKVAYALCVLDRESREVKIIHSVDCERGEFGDTELEPNFKWTGDKLLCLLKNAGEVVHIDPQTSEIRQYVENFRFGVQEQRYFYDVLIDRGALVYEEPGVADLDMLIRHYAGS